jgi:hypothetical protein
MRMIDPEDSEVVYTFTTSSRGGVSAVAKLVGEFGRGVRMHPGQLPIVEIGSGSYQHKDRSLGRIKFPTFKIVGWTADPTAALTGPGSEAPFEDAAPAKTTKKR